MLIVTSASVGGSYAFTLPVCSSVSVCLSVCLSVSTARYL